MATLEERLARVEHEIARVEHENAELQRSNAELQKAVELLNIAIGALVNKATLEKVNEQNDKIFGALISHDQLTNHQLAELREQLTEQDGKIVGLQTEMRQRFAEVSNRFNDLDARFSHLDARFNHLETRFTDLEKLLIDRLPPPPQ